MSRPGNGLRRHGLSIVELLVGVTIGLFILAGATVVMSTQLGDNRRMLLEAQVQQDLRAVLDIVVRDVRRAGYWAQAWNNVWQPDAAQAMRNPYNNLTTETDSVLYDRSQDESGAALGTDNNVVDDDETVGFRHNADARTVEMRIGNSWQTLTDPAVLSVTQFSIAVRSRSVPLPCGALCPPGPTLASNVLCLQVRDVVVTIVANAVHDSSVSRSASSDVRLRNDVLVEQAAPC